MFKIYDEPESPHERACLRCMMNRNCHMRGHMDPLRTRDKDIVFANGGAGCAPPQPPCFLFTPCRLALKNIVPSTRTVSGGATSRPTLVLFSFVQDRFKYHPAS